MLSRITSFTKNQIFNPTILSRSMITNHKYFDGENIFTKKDFPQDKINFFLDDKTIGVIGYGPQGKSQSLNLRDSGRKVIVGVRTGDSYNQALKDGWVPGETLFSISEATYNSDIIKYLLSDVGQIKSWHLVEPNLKPENTLYFSHGFGITYNKHTDIIPPPNVDVVMVAPKGAGISVREKYLEGKGINCSFAVYQDYTRKAQNTCLSLAYSIGCDTAFQTTFEQETYSDLTGERGVLMGMIQGAFSAQYKVLRENGHSASEAYNETVEEALVSLYPLINQKGMDWLYSNCSTTAQLGAINWAPKFERAIRPVIEECYQSVKDGSEAEEVIKANSSDSYRQKLQQSLDEISNQELWVVAQELRKLRA